MLLALLIFQKNVISWPSLCITNGDVSFILLVMVLLPQSAYMVGVRLVLASGKTVTSLHVHELIGQVKYLIPEYIKGFFFLSSGSLL